MVASLSGWSRHYWRDSSQVVAPTDIFVVDPGAVHTTVAEKDSCWRFVTAHLPIALFSRFQQENAPIGSRSLSFSRSVFQHGKFHRLLICLHQSVVEDQSPLYQDYCLQELVCTLWNTSREPLHLSRTLAASRSALNAARDYLHEHFSAKIPAKQLADIAGLNEFHFCRQFSQRFGLSPHAYQFQLRLTTAKRMLRAGSPIGMIAQAVGFSSQSHFARAFLRVNGITPARFQKNSRIVPSVVLP